MPEFLDDEIESLIRAINTGGGDGLSEDASKAKLQALLSVKVGNGISALSGSIFSVQRVLGQRLGELNEALKEAQKELGARLEELNGALEKTRDELRESSKVSAKYSKVLALWTIVLALATSALVVVSYMHFQAAERAMQAQIEPQIRAEMNNTENGAELVVTNMGAYQVANLNIDPESTAFLGAPTNKIVGIKRYRPRTPELNYKAWWHLERLRPEEIQMHSINDVLEEELKLQKIKHDQKSSGTLPGISSKDKSPLHLLIHFRISYLREADLKLFRITKSSVLSADSKTGKPMLIDTKVMEYLEPGLREILDKVSEEEHLFRSK